MRSNFYSKSGIFRKSVWADFDGEQLKTFRLKKYKKLIINSLKDP